VYASHTLCM